MQDYFNPACAQGNREQEISCIPDPLPFKPSPGQKYKHQTPHAKPLLNQPQVSRFN
jgi:hypothetical protein